MPVIATSIRKKGAPFGVKDMPIGAVSEGQFLSLINGEIRGASVPGGAPPTGTGFRHVTGGVEDAASKLVDTADVNNDQITYAKLQNVSATDKLLGRATAGAGDVEEVPCTPFVRTVLDDADAAAVRATIGAGTGNGTVTGVTGTAPIASSGGAAPVISLNDDGVTFAKMQNVGTDRLVGRDTAASGDPEELTVGGGIEFTGAGGVQTAAFTGDVTKGAGGTAQTIANDAVTYAKMQNVSAASKLLGRGSAGGAGDTEEIALGTNLSMSGTTLNATGGGGGINTLKTTADQTINAGAGVFTDITGLTFTVVNGVDYAFKFYIVFQSAASATGWKASVNCPAGTLDFWCFGQNIANGAAGVATHLERHNVTRDDMTLLTATITQAVDLVVMIEGRYKCTADGTFAARFANELAANTNIVVQKGSWGWWF
jgi:hypothetical protein